MIFLTIEDSLNRIINVVDWRTRHGHEKLKSTRMSTKGHVRCLRCNNKERTHIFSWSSSPTNENLVNSRMNHGILCSGILPADYNRLVKGAGIGIISDEKRITFFNTYVAHIQKEYDNSIELASLQEVASYEDS